MKDLRALPIGKIIHKQNGLVDAPALINSKRMKNYKKKNYKKCYELVEKASKQKYI